MQVMLALVDLLCYKDVMQVMLDLVDLLCYKDVMQVMLDFTLKDEEITKLQYSSNIAFKKCLF